MATPRGYADDDECWLDPNLAEPKLQDDLDRRLGLNRRLRQRPRAAYGHEKPQQRRQTELAQIRYFKYVPYNGMSEPEKRRYLSLGPARLTSSRTAPPRPAAKSAASTESTAAAASFWPSASRTKSLKVYDYHLAELSMAYRSPPSLLDQPRRQLGTPSGVSPRHHWQQEASLAAPRRPLFFQLHSNRGIPASAPSATQQELQASCGRNADVAEKTTQVSRGNTPFIDSALSDYPTEPRDVVSKSDSNRLLNVVSVDECHVRHRRRRRRLRRVHQSQLPAASGENEDAWANALGEEEYEEEEGYDEEEEDGGGDWRDAEATAEGTEAEEREAATPAVTHAHETRQELVAQSEQQEPVPSTAAAVVTTAAEPVAAPSVTTTRPTTERSGGGGRKKRRTEKEMRQIAAAKFLRRNEILREKMAIYLDWKLNQERMGLIELRLGDPAARFDRFTVEMVQQEASIASQYHDVDGTMDMSNFDAHAVQESPQLDLHSEASKRTAPQQQRAELSLTEMFEALNA